MICVEAAILSTVLVPRSTSSTKHSTETSGLGAIAKEDANWRAQFVGKSGEMKVDQDLREKGYERISTDAVTDLKDPTHKGIDGVYYNPDGDPPYLIVDAKYDKAKLKDEIGDGRQMSQKWIDARLDDAVGKDVADEIRMAQLNGDVGCYVGKVAKGGDLTAEVIYQQVDEAGEIVKGV